MDLSPLVFYALKMHRYNNAFFIYSTVQINLPFFVSLEGNLVMISPSCLADAWSLWSLMARILQYSY